MMMRGKREKGEKEDEGEEEEDDAEEDRGRGCSWRKMKKGGKEENSEGR